MFLYPFLITKCPCCSSPIGKTLINNQIKIVGLQRDNNEIQFVCENTNCEFYEKNLPIYVVDEDVYKYQPSVLIGTVDKFVRITWNKDSKKIFGLSPWDIRALEPIIKNAGGILKTWDNKKILNGGKIIACTNKSLFNSAAGILNKKKPS